MTKGQHPWPTDGVTKRQLDRQIDRLERLYQAHKGRIRELEVLVGSLAASLREARAVAHNNSDRINLIVHARGSEPGSPGLPSPGTPSDASLL